MSAERKCPNCDKPMARVQIIDKVQLGHTYLEYAVGEADRNIWTATFPVEGRVASFMCDTCGRIVLYGEQKE